MPEPDVDEPLLVKALLERDLASSVEAWDDPSVRWHDHDLVVLRSTWDYHHRDRIGAFLEWCDSCDAAGRLANPAGVIRWNASKRYLFDLEGAGIAVVPSTVVTPQKGAAEILLGDAIARLQEVGASTDELVIKPLVSAGSRDTLRIPGTTRAIASPPSGEDLLVQPFLPSVDGYGERSHVFIEGRWTHSVRKSPRFAGDHESVSDAVGASDAELVLARAAIDAAALATAHASPLLYARVDTAPAIDGTPLLMELELIEPSLFLMQHPPALAAFADAISRRAWSDH